MDAKHLIKVVNSLVDEARQAMEVVRILEEKGGHLSTIYEWRARAGAYRHALALLAGVEPDDVVTPQEVTKAGLKAIGPLLSNQSDRERVAEGFRSAGYILSRLGQEVHRGTLDECRAWLMQNTGHTPDFAIHSLGYGLREI